MIDWRDALDLRITAAGFNPRAVSLAAGLGATAVRDILSGRSQQPRRQTLHRIAQVLGCSVDEILNPPADLDLIIDQQNRERWGVTSVMASRPPARETAPRFFRKAADGARKIPVLDLKAVEADQPREHWFKGTLRLPYAVINSLDVGDPAVLTVHDDTMAPTLNAGDLLLIDLAVTRPRRDGLYVLHRPGDISIRRLQLGPQGDAATIIADNPKYPPIPNTPLSTLDIIGLVLWRGHAL